MKLEGRNLIVTGASQGLGKAIAESVLREGGGVFLCARTEADVTRTVEELRALFPGASNRLAGMRCDVSQAADVTAFFASAYERFPVVHGLINNAGIYGPMGPSEEVSWDEWTAAIEINLYGTFRCCRAAIPHFRQNGYGKIINISGGGATNPMPRVSAYAASKAAVVRLTETLAEELRGDRIDVNAIAPGALRTRMVKQVIEAGAEKVGAAFLEKNKQWDEKGGTPLSLGADLCVYLASAESDGITGKLISAQWDPWKRLHEHRAKLEKSDIYGLRRIVPEDRGENWGLNDPA